MLNGLVQGIRHYSIQPVMFNLDFLFPVIFEWSARKLAWGS